MQIDAAVTGVWLITKSFVVSTRSRKLSRSIQAMMFLYASAGSAPVVNLVMRYPRCEPIHRTRAWPGPAEVDLSVRVGLEPRNHGDAADQNDQAGHGVGIAFEDAPADAINPQDPGPDRNQHRGYRGQAEQEGYQ